MDKVPNAKLRAYARQRCPLESSTFLMSWSGQRTALKPSQPDDRSKQTNLDKNRQTRHNRRHSTQEPTNAHVPTRTHGTSFCFLSGKRPTPGAHTLAGILTRAFVAIERRYRTDNNKNNPGPFDQICFESVFAGGNVPVGHKVTARECVPVRPLICVEQRRAVVQVNLDIRQSTAHQSCVCVLSRKQHRRDAVGISFGAAFISRRS